jgi:8-oxo-dGTP diphosphatase
MTRPKKVKAGGGIVWRRSRGRIEVLLVHRPRYDDWSFPKGKLERDEKYRDGAVREVQEETGFSVVLGPELDPTRYTDALGRPKKVRYWAMTVRKGSFVPNDEVDSIEWVPLDDVPAWLTYAHDIEVLDSFRQVVRARS